jgi:hypothetical protein
MKRSAFDVDGRHLLIGDDNTAGVLAAALTRLSLVDRAAKG